MKIEELKAAMQAADAAVVLVTPRIISRVQQAEQQGREVLQPNSHDRLHIIDRQRLFRFVDEDELELSVDRMLPNTIILMARPHPDEMQEWGSSETLLRYWRLLFHARVDVTMRRRWLGADVRPEELDARIARIGRTEFTEIRNVLIEERYLTPDATDAETYCEFAAVYLELRAFRPNLRATYFPLLQDFDRIDKLLAVEIDEQELQRQTRLPGAPEPTVRTDSQSDESHDHFERLMRLAEHARQANEVVRAAILHKRALRVAPTAAVGSTNARAMEDLGRLTHRFILALRLENQDEQEWLDVLQALLEKADQGQWPVEAQLLHELEKVCAANEQKLFRLDLVEYLIAAGHRPIKRPLSSLQVVRTTAHLRSAAAKLPMARVSDDHRQRLHRLLKLALELSETRLRDRFRPLLANAFEDVGLVAANAAEQVALAKMIEELLDRISEYGFITFSELRDTISRNQLKLADLADPFEFWRGDPLIGLDRRLASRMEGVYQPGDFYLRWLEHANSLAFGTWFGRFFCQNLLLPFGASYLALRTLQDAVLKKEFKVQTTLYPEWTCWIIGILVLLLMHVPPLRTACVKAARWLLSATYSLCVDFPRWVLQTAWLQRALRSWPVLLTYWYVLRPSLVCLPIGFFKPEWFNSMWEIAVAFLLSNLVINSRFGFLLGEGVAELFSVAYRQVRLTLFESVLRGVMRFFKRATETVEYVLHSVDEMLRLKADEGRFLMAVRAVLGALWYPVAFTTRFLFVVAVEPNINPIKLVLSFIAFKMMLPFVPMLNRALADAFSGQMSTLAAHTTAGLIIFYLLPGACAFLIWEIKENWTLFRANRPRSLQPVAIGHHGETMQQLLTPGFHSGTVPKLFRQLRQAERVAYRTDNWRPARTCRVALDQVAQAIKLCVEREFVALLHQGGTPFCRRIAVAQVQLARQSIRVDFSHGDYLGEITQIQFENSQGWLIGSVSRRGWLDHASEADRLQFERALAGLFKIAGVVFVPPQLSRAFDARVTGVEIHEDHLLVTRLVEERAKPVATARRPGDKPQPDKAPGHPAHRDIAPAVTPATEPLRYALREPSDSLPARDAHGHPIPKAPALRAAAVLYSRVPLAWDRWIRCWDSSATAPAPSLFDEPWRFVAEATDRPSLLQQRDDRIPDDAHDSTPSDEPASRLGIVSRAS